MQKQPDWSSANRRRLEESRYDGASLAASRLSLDDCDRVFRWIKEEKNFLIYLGVPGCGKTHLCHSVKNFLSKDSLEVKIWPARSLLSRVRADMNLQGDYMSSLSYHTEYKYLILDDLGSDGLNDWRNEVWTAFVDSRYSSTLPTMITSNLSEEEILERMGKRIHSRMFSKENVILNFGTVDWRRT